MFLFFLLEQLENGQSSPRAIVWKFLFSVCFLELTCCVCFILFPVDLGFICYRSRQQDVTILIYDFWLVVCVHFISISPSADQTQKSISFFIK